MPVMSWSDVDALSLGERRRPSTEIEARLPRSSASLLEDSLNHSDEWLAAKDRYFLSTARRALSARSFSMEATACLCRAGMSEGLSCGPRGRDARLGEWILSKEARHGGREVGMADGQCRRFGLDEGGGA